MKILVCLKRVPDTNAKIRIHADGKGIVTEGVDFVISPFDEFAIEQGLQIKEKGGATEVVVLSVGDGSAPELRKALAMGADRGVQLKPAQPGGLDPLSTAKLIAEHAKTNGFEMILCGKASVDDGNYQVPGLVAALLDWAVVNTVVHMQLEGRSLLCKREIESGLEIVEAQCPVVISCQKGLNDPRFTSLKGVMAAKKKVVEEVAVTASAAKMVVTQMELPVARAAGKVLGEGPAAVPALIAALRGEAKVI